MALVFTSVQTGSDKLATSTKEYGKKISEKGKTENATSTMKSFTQEIGSKINAMVKEITFTSTTKKAT